MGFIHCSFEHQVETVANYTYPDWDDDLLLLQVDPAVIRSEVRVENLDGTEAFPHIYGPLPTEAVTAVRRLVREAGQWRLPRSVVSGEQADSPVVPTVERGGGHIC